MNFPYPVCAVCGKPVERMRMTYDESTDAVFVVVNCHGNIDQMVVRAAELRGVVKVEGGKAFEKEVQVRAAAAVEDRQKRLDRGTGGGFFGGAFQIPPGR